MIAFFVVSWESIDLAHHKTEKDPPREGIMLPTVFRCLICLRQYLLHLLIKFNRFVSCIYRESEVREILVHVFGNVVFVHSPSQH